MKNQNLILNIKNASFLEDTEVVGYCQIGHNRYPIVEIENGLRNSDKLKRSDVDDKWGSQLSCFEIDGKVFVVLESENLLSNSQDLAVDSLLTERELQIATFVAQGNSNKQIAIHLKISEWTVSSHLRRIFVKLCVDSRAAMVYRCANLLHQL
jgi:ATP/maltotriose-dependent transcriptional regulator MalT